MPEENARLTVKNALSHVPEHEEERFKTLFAHGSLEVEIYAPRGVDPQEPHERDEIYVIISGTGSFLKDGDRRPFEPGEVIFVPAGMDHRFEDFSDDFATWVFFYGPNGGEAGT
jgi:mannose-6-phosphate isomerase-like protein (cupin superfamily)